MKNFEKKNVFNSLDDMPQLNLLLEEEPFNLVERDNSPIIGKCFNGKCKNFILNSFCFGEEFFCSESCQKKFLSNHILKCKFCLSNYIEKSIIELFNKFLSSNSDFLSHYNNKIYPSKEFILNNLKNNYVINYDINYVFQCLLACGELNYFLLKEMYDNFVIKKRQSQGNDSLISLLFKFFILNALTYNENDIAQAYPIYIFNAVLDIENENNSNTWQYDAQELLLYLLGKINNKRFFLNMIINVI